MHTVLPKPYSNNKANCDSGCGLLSVGFCSGFLAAFPVCEEGSSQQIDVLRNTEVSSGFL